MVVEKVCHTPIATTLAIALSMNKTFLSCHLFNKDGKGLVEFFKGEELDQMLLRFVPLCSPSIHNFIASLKHRPINLGSIDDIFKLQALSIYDFFRTIIFMVNKLGKRYICSRCPWMDLPPDLIWSNECKWVMIYKMRG